ncbi:hypothetical protein ACIF8T_35495 [Streptomyces sp. NPDC085946]|uniref:hypothetical protein n=1 Tax=Streptomyces sp. NPDC085946 TaxID=3365744 RepID=UPI0037D8F294
MRSRIEQWKTKVGPLIFWTTVVCGVAGPVFLVGGVVGDVYGFWTWAFTTNVLSSFTGLLLGLLLAMVFISRLNEEQQKIAQREEAIRRSSNRVTDFFNELKRPFSGDEAQIVANLQELQIANRNLKRQLKDEDGPQDCDQRRAESRLVHELVVERNTARTAAYTLQGKDLNAWVSLLAHRWARIESEVRPLVLAAGLHWISDAHDVTIQRAVQKLGSVELPARVRMRFMGYQRFEPPFVPDSAEWAEARELLLKEVEEEVNLTSALRDVISLMAQIERIGT